MKPGLRAYLAEARAGGGVRALRDALRRKRLARLGQLAPGWGFPHHSLCCSLFLSVVVVEKPFVGAGISDGVGNGSAYTARLRAIAGGGWRKVPRTLLVPPVAQQLTVYSSMTRRTQLWSCPNNVLLSPPFRAPVRLFWGPRRRGGGAPQPRHAARHREVRAVRARTGARRTRCHDDAAEMRASAARCVDV